MILFQARLWCVYLEDILSGQRELRKTLLCVLTPRSVSRGRMG